MHDPLFSLGARLGLCAGMVRPHALLADIGTDHAYLPVWLARRGLILRAVAADVRPGPLERAERNIRRYRVESMVSARLSDGLDAVSQEEADDIVMAGMGGILISNIIARTPWLKGPRKHLILQPMTSVEDLRRSLRDAGFSVLREQAALEEGHVYTAMLCVYDPPNCASGELFPYIGRLSAGTKENRMYLRREMKRLQNRAGGLKIQGDVKKAEELFRIRGQIGAILREAQEKMDGDGLL